MELLLSTLCNYSGKATVFMLCFDLKAYSFLQRLNILQCCFFLTDRFQLLEHMQELLLRYPSTYLIRYGAVCTGISLHFAGLC